jgi:hypothetical protein
MMTLESLILSLNSTGWLLGSLCQLARGDWYVCVIDDEGFAHSATAEDPCEAILFAIERPPMGRVYSRVIGMLEDSQGTPVDKIDLVDLGLKVRREPIKRRF